LAIILDNYTSDKLEDINKLAFSIFGKSYSLIIQNYKRTPLVQGGTPITGYKIYRSTSSGTETGYVSLGNVTSYTNTALTSGTTYFYKVRAVNSVGISSPSNEASATPT